MYKLKYFFNKLKYLANFLWFRSSIVILILALLSIFAYKNIITKPPQGRHQWSQADHLAVAQNYAENGLNFFKPRSYLLNLYPFDEVKSDEGITRADSQLGEYMVGVCMKITGADSYATFRLVMLIVSIIGLFFLFRLMQKNKYPLSVSILPLLFLFSWSVFLYYQCSFVTSVAAGGLCFIGYYYYFLYLNKHKFKHFLVAILFFFFAVLFRMPFAIALIAVFCQQIIFYLIKKEIKWKELLVFAILVSLLVANFIYHKYLQNTYGTIFLVEFHNAFNLDDYKEYLIFLYDHHNKTLFSNFTLLSFVLLFINVLVNIVYKWIKKEEIFTPFQRQLFIQFGISFIGGFIYFLLMIKQFYRHDYYFLDAFLISLSLLLIFLVSFIRWDKKYINNSIVIACILLLTWGYERAVKANEYFPVYEVDWRFNRVYDDMNKLLEVNNVGKEKVIAVPDPLFRGNMAFCRIQRKGFCYMNDGMDDLKNRKWIDKSDYVLISEISWLKDILPQDSTLCNELEFVSKYNSMLLFKYLGKEHKQVNKYTLDSSSAQIFRKNFEIDRNGADSIIFDSNMSSNHIAYVPNNQVYLEFFTIPISEIQPHRTSLIMVEFDIMPLEDGIAPVVGYAADKDNGMVLYDICNMFENTAKKDEWVTVRQYKMLLDVNKVSLLKFYLWNIKENKFLIDNVKFCFY